MLKQPISKTSTVLVDALFFVMGITLIFGLTAFGKEWRSSYNPNYQVDLSLSSLPMYSLFSALRGFIAYLVSLTFTLVIGFWAAKSERAEKIIIPFLDIMQSIPVLGFLPGLVLGLVALFPNTNIGLELASILMIFTGQVWNMAFAFYASLKSVPTDLKEASSVMNLTPVQKLKFLELPFSAMNLTWNSLMSMAGGWFFLTVCEAFTLGDKAYHLPGLGAYMAVAVEQGNTSAIVGGIISMALIIITFDVLIWRPALVFAHRFRLEVSNEVVEEPLIQLLIKDSFVVKLGRILFFGKKQKKFINAVESELKPKVRSVNSYVGPLKWIFKACAVLGGIFFLYAVSRAIVHFGRFITEFTWADWRDVLLNTAYTFVRVVAAVIIGTLWATPVGIWVAQSPKRLKIAQPIIQLMASFPAPMLYPLAISLFLYLNINFEISAMLLMLLGVQWYILFNVLAGALKIPTELKNAMDLIGSNKENRWRYLFLPSVFPSLVTGWVTAAGGAWNASIVSEVISYKGQDFVAHGLGADISQAAAHGDFNRLAACLFVMVVVVVILNRTFWSRIYRLSQTRFRLDL
ncbi:MAG: ABC transporter permease [Pseudobdellovibrio sp.]